MKFHPMARFFGKSTNTAFNAEALLNSDTEFRPPMPSPTPIFCPTRGEYLTHDPLPVYETVWLETDAIGAEIDTVVETLSMDRDFDRMPRRRRAASRPEKHQLRNYPGLRP